MKRMISIALMLCLIFILASCGEGSSSSLEASSDVGGETESFVKPEQYTSVLLITINPEFRLYLDKDGKVLAVEAVNKDAQSIKNSITFENQNFDTVIETIINSAHQNGFIKADATIHFEIVESKETDKAKADILLKCEKKATDTANELSVNVHIHVSEIQTNTTQSSSNVTSGVSQASSRPTESQNVSSPSSSTTTKPVHKHSFSDATCTEPKKCSCGAVEGTALGHNYKDGVCTRCKGKDPNFSFTSVLKMQGKWKFQHLVPGEMSDTELHSISLFICTPGEYCSNISIGDPLSSLPDDMQNDPDIKQYCDLFDGKYYYVGRGAGGDIKTVTEEGNTVTLVDTSGNKIVFTRSGEKVLKCSSAPAVFACAKGIPVGAEFTFVAN